MTKSSLALEAWVRDRSVETRNRVVEEHGYLCSRAARKFVRRGVDRSDLEQVASMGLIKAIDRYDPLHAVPFEAYAWRLVLGELMHYVRDCERLVRAPRRLRELDRRFEVAERELTSALDRSPSTSEVMEHMGSDSVEANEICCYRESTAVASIDALQPLEHRALAYTIEAQVDRILLEECLSALSTIEQQIMRAIYEHDVPIVEIAARLGYSRRHVSRLHGNALKKLSAIAESEPRFATQSVG